MKKPQDEKHQVRLAETTPYSLWIRTSLLSKRSQHSSTAHRIGIRVVPACLSQLYVMLA